MEPLEQDLQKACNGGKRFCGALLKLGFRIGLVLMSCGTLLIALYTLFVRGIR